MKLVAVVGSAVRGSFKTRLAVETAIRAAVECQPSLDTDIIDLSEENVSILDGRPATQYDDVTVDVLARLASGTMFLFASPVYRGSYTGALKNLLDHLPLSALESKVVGLIGTGATLHHYLAIDQQFRSVFAWFNAYVLPGSVYLDNADFSRGALVDPARCLQLEQLGQSLVAVARGLENVPAIPPSLARQMMPAPRAQVVNSN